jgi:two-component system chemotaxis sensor kinase CheA
MIALTSKSSASDATAGRDAGFTDYVQKFERDGLIQSLQQCLSHRELA